MEHLLLSPHGYNGCAQLAFGDDIDLNLNAAVTIAYTLLMLAYTLLSWEDDTNSNGLTGWENDANFNGTTGREDENI